MLITEANELNFEQFTATFGNVIEHCPIVAAAVWSELPFQDVENLHNSICSFIDKLPLEGQAGILRCHPDLAGRLADAGDLTDESKLEQKAAGLDTLTSQEKTTLRQSNAEYKKKFGFPFVICARENKKDAILKGIVARLENQRLTEIQAGIEEVKKIGFLRINSIINGTPSRL